MDGAVGFVLAGGGGGFVSEKEVAGSARAAFGDRKIRCVAFDSEEHVAGGVADYGIGMGGAIVEQLGEFLHCCCCCLGLFGGEFADRCKKRGVDGASVEKKSSENFKNARSVGGIERRGIIGNSCELGFGAVVGSLPRVWRVFGFAGGLVLETMQCTIDVSRHGYVACARIVVPLES